MSTPTRAQQLALEAAERRVLENLRITVEARSSARRVAVLVAAAVLFSLTFAARLAIKDPGALIANFYVAPIALLAIEFGTRAGVLAAAVALGLVFVWSAVETVHLGALGYVSRGAALLMAGALVGSFSERLRQDISERRRAQRDLSLYADELERANHHLAESVERLEAFAGIAREVGGETDLQRILGLILARCQDIVRATRYFVCVPERDQLIVITDDARAPRPQPRLSLNDSLPGSVLLSCRPLRVSVEQQPRELYELAAGARAAILVPLIFRGESLGVLVGVDRDNGPGFESDDEQLLLSVAASAATAVATARSVAAVRLRLSIEAAEQARARWARELHDETLQALTGVRMVLSAGLAREDPDALREATAAADAHLAEELRSLRDLIAELRPAALDDLGLGPAIVSLAKRQAAIGRVAVDVDLGLSANGRLDPDTEGAIYRIVQEALSNVVKHARAQRVIVAVRQLEQRIEITVQDDGVGFQPARASEGFGITGMRERALLAGGRLSVSSSPGGPTRVTAVLPPPGLDPPASPRLTTGTG